METVLHVVVEENVLSPDSYSCQNLASETIGLKYVGINSSIFLNWFQPAVASYFAFVPYGTRKVPSCNVSSSNRFWIANGSSMQEVTVLKASHLLKIPSPRFEILDGIVTEVSLEQFINAWLSIISRPSGKYSSLNWHATNASHSIDLIPSERNKLDNELQP